MSSKEKFKEEEDSEEKNKNIGWPQEDRKLRGSKKNAVEDTIWEWFCAQEYETCRKGRLTTKNRVSYILSGRQTISIQR